MQMHLSSSNLSERLHTTSSSDARRPPPQTSSISRDMYSLKLNDDSPSVRSSPRSPTGKSPKETRSRTTCTAPKLVLRIRLPTNQLSSTENLERSMEEDEKRNGGETLLKLANAAALMTSMPKSKSSSVGTSTTCRTSTAQQCVICHQERSTCGCGDRQDPGSPGGLESDSRPSTPA